MMVRTYSPNPEFMPSSRWRESCGTRGAISGGSFFSSVSIAVVMLLTLASRPLAASPCIPAADQPTLVEACSGKSVSDACASQDWVGTCQVNACGISNFDGQATPDIIECYLTSPADAAVSYEDGGFEWPRIPAPFPRRVPMPPQKQALNLVLTRSTPVERRPE